MDTVTPSKLEEPSTFYGQVEEGTLQKNANWSALDSPQPQRLDAKKFTIASIMLGLLILLLFFGNFVYVFGSTFQQSSRNHAYRIAALNYDVDGPIWKAITNAYSSLKSDQFPSLIFEESSNFPTPQNLIDAVRSQNYWGAIYVTCGASARLSNATLGRSSSYSGHDSIAYVWNEIRYPATSTSVIKAGIMQLQTVAAVEYQKSAIDSFVENFKGLNGLNAQIAMQAFLAPFDAVEINIKIASEASNVLYNTLAMAGAIVQQNIFVIAFHNMSKQFGLFNRPFKSSAPWVLGVGLTYTFLAALVLTSTIYAFRENWAITGTQFVETWMVMWLVNHIYYQLMDGTLGLVPIKVYSLMIISFLFISITTTIFPLESCAGFYRWGQSLPTLQGFHVLVDIWSNSSSKLYEALAILFAWWVASAAYAISGTIAKCKAASKTAT
jgi:hypothetical protein